MSAIAGKSALWPSDRRQVQLLRPKAAWLPTLVEAEDKFAPVRPANDPAQLQIYALTAALEKLVRAGAQIVWSPSMLQVAIILK